MALLDTNPVFQCLGGTAHYRKQSPYIHSKNFLIFGNSLFFIQPYIGGGGMKNCNNAEIFAKCQIGQIKMSYLRIFLEYSQIFHQIPGFCSSKIVLSKQ